MLDSDASTAKTLTLVAIILQLIFFVIGILGVIGLAVFTMTTGVTNTYLNGTTTFSSITVAPSIGLLIVSAILLTGIVWILLDYFLVYKKLKLEKVREAETPSLVLGILQLIFGGIIPGILLIIAYVKIRDSVERNPTREGQIPPTL